MDSEQKLDLGSPPHTRGECIQKGNRERNGGITPAYAGRILWFPSTTIDVWDHPRIRGENLLKGPPSKVLGGSPPHTRGELLAVGDEFF